jgi:hypothetical protein
MGRWAKEISEFIKSFGINPIYPTILLMLFLSYVNFKKLKRWDELVSLDRAYAS